jgi:hypothetical protein
VSGPPSALVRKRELGRGNSEVIGARYSLEYLIAARILNLKRGRTISDSLIGGAVQRQRAHMYLKFSEP